MNDQQRAAMQMALEALEELHYSSGTVVAARMYESATAALREALGTSLKRKCFADYQPNHAIDRACASCPVSAECQTGEQAEQEPVAWLVQYKDCHTFVWGRKPEFIVDGVVEPLYAAHVRTKDLTDDEIEELANEGLIRYFEAKLKEKNTPPVVPQGESVADALRHAAQIVELYDDATMTGDYMIDSTDCAGILNALAEYHARFYTTPPSVEAAIEATKEATKERAARICDVVLGDNEVSAVIRSMK